MTTSTDTCFSLTEKLRSLFVEYGEEQIIVSLGSLLEQSAVNDDQGFMDSEKFEEEQEIQRIRDRATDLYELNNKWG